MKRNQKATENLGLNPSHDGETKPEKIAESSPAYLSNILEQDFYDTNDTKGKTIKGITIGLAMNSVYYYQKEKDGETYSKSLDNKEIEKQGKAMAQELLTRLRANKDLKNIPIHFAIYMFNRVKMQLRQDTLFLILLLMTNKLKLINGIKLMRFQHFYLQQKQKNMTKI